MKLRLNQKNIPILATIAVFFLIYTVGSVMYTGFFSLRVFTNLFIDNAFVGVIAIGRADSAVAAAAPTYVDLKVGQSTTYRTKDGVNHTVQLESQSGRSDR